MKSTHAIIIAIAGLILAAAGLTGLTRNQEDALRHERNPFALQGSGYGKLLARLSQDTIDKVWHIGVEQVNPAHHDHDHGECNHEHGHCDHDHDHDHQSDHDHGHDHGLADGDHERAGDGHEHDDPAHGHESERASLAAGEAGLIPAAKDWLSELKDVRYERTNPKSMTEAHRLTVAADIENMLLRGYRMDPTDYGVYNGYFLFLTIHKLRATPRARDHARAVSRNTIACAAKEDTDPAPWMTGAMAVLNLFFLDLEDYRARNEEPPAGMVREYRQQMAHCLRQFGVLREKSIHEKRWLEIPLEQRVAMTEREQFARKTYEQFDAMLARSEGGREEEEHTAANPAPAKPPVAVNSPADKAG